MKRGWAAGLAIAAVVAAVFAVWRCRGSDEAASRREARDPSGARGSEAARSLALAGTGRRRAAVADPQGLLRLEGQVVDADMQPVAGAVVAIDTNPVSTVRSEDDGSFSFDRLLARHYTVEAVSGPLYAPALSMRLTEVSDPVVLQLRPGAEVEVSVVDAVTLAPIAGASVEVAGYLRLAPVTATTAPNGVARLAGLAPGTIEIRATAESYAPGEAALAIPVGATAALRETVALLPGAPVSGAVSTADGRPIEGARVTASLGDSPVAVEATSDVQGRWQFSALSAGTYRFTASHPDHGHASSALTEHDGQRATADVTIVIAEAPSVRGKVIDSNGEPVAGAAVFVAEVERIASSHLAQTLSDERGEFAVAGLPQRLVEVAAWHAVGSSQPISIDLSSPAEAVELRLTTTGVVRGTVVAADGEPVDAASVSLECDERQEFWCSRIAEAQEQLSNAGGEFDFAGLPPGTYTVRARKAGAGDGIAKASPGDSVRLTLTAYGAIRGRVASSSGDDPPSWFAVSVDARDTRFLGTEGVFELRDVEARAYRVAVAGPFETAELGELTVEPGKTLDVGTVEVKAGRKLVGVVRTGDGRPVAAAKVLAGESLEGGAGGLRESERAVWKQASTTLSRSDGSFEIVGAARRAIVVAAEHPHLGSSTPLPVPAGNDADGLELVVERSGAVQGTIRKGDQPVAMAEVDLAPADGSFRRRTLAGPDGIYRFDRVPPGPYRVAASLTPEATSSQFTQAATRRGDVEIVAGAVVSLDFTFARGVNVTVGVRQRGTTYGPIQVLLVRGAIDVDTTEELDEARKQRAGTDILTSFLQFGDGRVASGQFRDVEPDVYTACVQPVQLKLAAGGQEVTMESIEGQRVTCRRVGAASGKSELDVSIELPEQ